MKLHHRAKIRTVFRIPFLKKPSKCLPIIFRVRNGFKTENLIIKDVIIAGAVDNGEAFVHFFANVKEILLAKEKNLPKNTRTYSRHRSGRYPPLF